MRFKEFRPRYEKDQKVDEFLPAALGVGARLAAPLAARALGAGARMAGNAISKFVSPQALRTQVAKQIGGAAGAAAFNKTTAQGDDQPVQLKPGMGISHPGIGQTKIKTITGPDVELDTQKELGQNIKVKKNELLAIMGQGQASPDSEKDKPDSIGTVGTIK